MARSWPASVELRADVGPMPRQKIADQMVSLLRTEIATGALPRGARLPTERELAERFGVSGPTVREAIRGLSALGLVKVRHGSGVYVAPDSDRILAVSLGTLVQLEGVGVEEIVRICGALMEYAARLAVERATEDEIAALRAAAEATIAAVSVSATADALGTFLNRFVETAHDRLVSALTRFLVNLVIELELSGHDENSAHVWPRWVATVGSLRLAMLERLAARDADGLVAAVSEYHDVVVDRIRAVPQLRDARLSDPRLAPYLARIVAPAQRDG